MKNFFYTALLLIFAASAASAQPIREMQRSKKLEYAEKAYLEGNTSKAEEIYREIYEDDKAKGVTDLSIMSRIADLLYFSLRDYKEAEKWYSKLSKADKENEYPITKFSLGRVLKMNQKYDEAIVEFQAFVNAYNGENADKYRKLVQNEIAGAELGKAWASDKTSTVMIEPAGTVVNTPTQDLSPVSITRDEFFFASTRADSVQVLDVENPKDADFFRIYRVRKGGKGWENPTLVGTEVNKPKTHNAHPAFSPNKDAMYFTRLELPVNQVKHSDVYRSKYNGGAFSEAEKLGFNSTSYSCKQPALGLMDGKETIFFASDMDGGQGGWDIWYAMKNPDGSFGTPLNLGPEVNTFGDEECPFFYEGVIYFSSNGQTGIGGFDVYSSTYNRNGSWGKVANLGPSYNSSVDDMYFTMGEDPCYGYMVSNRPGTISVKRSSTCCDDVFTLVMPDRCPVDITVENFDKITKQPLSGCTVTLYDDKNVKVDEITDINSNKVTFHAKRGVNYRIVSTKNGYSEDKGTASTLNAAPDRPSSQSIKLNLDPSMKVTVRAFDAKDKKTPISNLTVSLIDASGKELDKKNITTGNECTFDLISGSSYKVTGTKQNWSPDTKGFNANDVNGKFVDIYLGLPIFDTIYYDFDKSNILPAASARLDKIVETMVAYPNLVVEVGSHTDGMGSDPYNDQLSNRRTASAMEYLTKKGLPAGRLIPKAYGETQPWYPNTKPNGSDNPIGRQYNRRTVFRVIDGAVPAPAPVTPPAKEAEKPKEKVKEAPKAKETKPADKPKEKAAPAPAKETGKPANDGNAKPLQKAKDGMEKKS